MGGHSLGKKGRFSRITAYLYLVKRLRISRAVLPASCAEVENKWSYSTSSPLCLHDMCRENLITFIFGSKVLWPLSRQIVRIYLQGMQKSTINVRHETRFPDRDQNTDVTNLRRNPNHTTATCTSWNYCHVDVCKRTPVLYTGQEVT
jgi:hypothetical protein